MKSVFPELDLQRLILDARQGNQKALDQICNGMRPVVERICHSFFPEYLSAKAGESDLVQESMIAALQSFTTFRGTLEAELLAWFQGIAENKSKDLIRRFHADARDIKRERLLSLETSSRLEILLADSSAVPLDKLITKEEIERLQRLVQELPAHHQEVVQLRHRDGMTFPEIARFLGNTEASVKGIYVRALEMLDRNLSK